jgi:hypothetical protein
VELKSKENCIVSKVFIVETTDLSEHNMRYHSQGEAHSMSTSCELYVNKNNKVMGIHHKIITLHKLKINSTNQLFLKQCRSFSFPRNLSTRAPMCWRGQEYIHKYVHKSFLARDKCLNQ